MQATITACVAPLFCSFFLFFLRLGTQAKPIYEFGQPGAPNGSPVQSVGDRCWCCWRQLRPSLLPDRARSLQDGLTHPGLALNHALRGQTSETATSTIGIEVGVVTKGDSIPDRIPGGKIPYLRARQIVGVGVRPGQTAAAH